MIEVKIEKVELGRGTRTAVVAGTSSLVLTVPAVAALTHDATVVAHWQVMMILCLAAFGTFLMHMKSRRRISDLLVMRKRVEDPKLTEAEGTAIREFCLSSRR
jgi:hypothetical protein